MIVSVNADDLAAVVELACLTESRTNDEQRRLLRVAEKLDRKLNEHTNQNPRWRAFVEGQAVEFVETRYEREVHFSRVLEDREQHVKPSQERDSAKVTKREAARQAEVDGVLAGREL